MKSLAGLMLMVCLVARAANNPIALHLECRKADRPCKEMKDAGGKKLRVRATPVFYFSPESVSEASVSTSLQGNEVLSIELTKGAAKEFEEVTKNSIGKILVLALGEKVISSPVVKSSISEGRLVIENGNAKRINFLEEAPWLKEKFRNGK